MVEKKGVYKCREGIESLSLEFGLFVNSFYFIRFLSTPLILESMYSSILLRLDLFWA